MDLNTIETVLRPRRRTDLAEGHGATTVAGLSRPWRRRDPPPEIAHPARNASQDAAGAPLTAAPFAADRTDKLGAAETGAEAACP
ncbi:MAG: hypothetical protein INR70_10420 [Parafilimonas terrae]|nr:hypothetical protein [Parafilimonas terrae]